MKKDLELNRDKILKLVGIMDEALRELKFLGSKDKGQVVSSRDRFALENLFYRLSMVCIDICFHVASKIKGRVPDSYRGCFRQLVEAGIIDLEQGRRLEDLAGLRNFLAHVYWDIDYARLYDFISELDSIEDFKNRIIALVDE